MSRKMLVPFHGDGIISQFEGYERARGARLGRVPRAVRRQDPATGPDPAGRGRRPGPLQAGQAGRHGHALLPVLRGGARRAVRAARVRASARTPLRRNIEYYDARTSHGSTLSFITHAAVLAELDPESSWERFLVALESDIGDVQGGTTKEGIHMGVMSGTLDLVQRGYLGTAIRGGRPVLRAAVDRSPRGPLVRDAVPRDADPPEPRRRPADRGGPRRGRLPTRSGSASATRSASCVRGDSFSFALAGAPAARVTANVPDGLRRRGLRRRRRARRLAARARVARGAARAHGGRVERHPGRDDLVAGGVHPAGLPAGHVGQAAAQRGAGGAGPLRGAGRRAAGDRLRRPQADDGDRAHRGGASSRPTPTRCASCSRSRAAGVRIAAASSSKNAGLFLRQDPPRHVRPGAGPRRGRRGARTNAARHLRRRRLGPRLRPRQAAPRDLPDRRRRARRPAGALLRRRGRRLGHPGRQGGRDGRAGHRPGRRRGGAGRRGRRPGGQSLDEVDVERLGRGAPGHDGRLTAARAQPESGAVTRIGPSGAVRLVRGWAVTASASAPATLSATARACAGPVGSKRPAELGHAVRASPRAGRRRPPSRGGSPLRRMTAVSSPGT